MCQSAFKLIKNISYVDQLRHASTTSEHSQNIFDRAAKRLQKERSAQRPDVALFDYIKDEVGYRLSDRIFDIKREFKNAADIGNDWFELKMFRHNKLTFSQAVTEDSYRDMS